MFKYSPPFSKQWARVHILLITFWPKYLLASLAALALPSIVLLASVVLGTVPQHIRLFTDWLDYGLSLMTITACSVLNKSDLMQFMPIVTTSIESIWLLKTLTRKKLSMRYSFIEIMAAFQMKWNEIKCGFTFCHPSMTWKIKHTSTKVVNCSNVEASMPVLRIIPSAAPNLISANLANHPFEIHPTSICLDLFQ